MSFNYKTVAHKNNDHGSWWTSYADLFMMLSIVFLLMYVASSLRQGTQGFQQVEENQKLARKAEELQEQIKVYNTLKDKALREQSSAAEQQVYQKLMSKLNLLQEEARDEKNSLQQQAKENEEKEFALNQYQALIRNIINANILAKTQIQRRDDMIVAKDATIEEKKTKIVQMEQIVAQNQAQINTINSQLSDKISALRSEQQRSRTSKTQLEKRIAALRNESEQKIQNLEGKNRGIEAQLNIVRSNLDSTSQELAQKQQHLAEVQGSLDQTNQELESKQKALVEKQRRLAGVEAEKQLMVTRAQGLEGQVGNLQGKVAQANQDLQSKDQALAEKQRAMAAAEAARQAALEKAKGLQGQVGNLQGKVAQANQELQGKEKALADAGRALAEKQQAAAAAEAERAAALERAKGLQGQVGNLQGKVGNLQGQVQGLQGTLQGLQGDLGKLRELADARKKLARRIADTLSKSGVKGNVDAGTGEVTLDFGGEYFDTGSAQLKPGMKATLDKFMPSYAKSLFSDPKIASKIGNVEIVGFASSTFKGRYVNPKSSRPQDHDAIEYNLKLSFGRANSIFKHVIDQNELKAEDRDRLMPLLKVVGRGYLPEGKTSADIPANISEKEFCSKYNCKAAQKVIIKFNMKD